MRKPRVHAYLEEKVDKQSLYPLVVKSPGKPRLPRHLKNQQYCLCNRLRKGAKPGISFFFFSLIGSSVVASVVLPQFVQSPPFYYQNPQGKNKKRRVKQKKKSTKREKGSQQKELTIALRGNLLRAKTHTQFSWRGSSVEIGEGKTHTILPAN